MGYNNPVCVGDELKFNVRHATKYDVAILTTNMSTIYKSSENITDNLITVWTPQQGIATGIYIAKMTFYSPAEEITNSYRISVIHCSKSADTSDSTEIRNDEIVLTDLVLTNNTDFTNKDLGFVIIPNPNPGIFQLETNFPLTDIAHLKIITPLGTTLYETQTLSSNTIQLPTSATGLHFVVIMLKNGAVLTQKMVIQR